MIQCNRFALGSLMAIVLTLAMEGGARASGGFPVIATHYKPKFVSSKTIPYLCDNPSTSTEEPNYSPNYTNTPCINYVTSLCPFGPGQVYVVLAQAGSEGIGAVSFGVDYDGSEGSGIDPRYISWSPCADGLSFPNNDGVHGDFPQPGGGLRITWLLPGSCQYEVIPPTGVHAVIGVFYVYAYSDDNLTITPNNNLQTGPEVAITDCLGVETRLSDLWGPNTPFLLGRVGFGSQYGNNPCLVHPVLNSSWGKLKSFFKGNP